MNATNMRVGRLAFRVEGALWNCYWAQHGTMEHSVLMGSLNMKLAENSLFKNQFMQLMKDCLADVIRDLTNGEVADWSEERAAEHERSGNA
jgi:hypothetical protein